MAFAFRTSLHASIALGAISLLGTACAVTVPDDTTTGDSALEAPTFVRAKVIDRAFGGETQAFATKQEALAAGPALLEAHKQHALQTCANEFGLARTDVFVRFDGCSTSASGPIDPSGHWFGDYLCKEAYCAAQPLTDVEV